MKDTKTRILKKLKSKRELLDKKIENIEKEMAEFGEVLRENEHYKNFVKHKYCIVCANRDPELDFCIPDGIVCTHPCNQNGKDKFQCYTHTCENWKREIRENKSIKEGTLVRWNEYPDSLYVVKGKPKQYCGRMCYRIESLKTPFESQVAWVGEEDITIEI